LGPFIAVFLRALSSGVCPRDRSRVQAILGSSASDWILDVGLEASGLSPWGVELQQQASGSLSRKPKAWSLKSKTPSQKE
jgi:hypothetical protein